MTLDEKIAVMNAKKAGKRIECKSTTNPPNPSFADWTQVMEPKFNFADFDFRVVADPIEYPVFPPIAGDDTWYFRINNCGIRLGAAVEYGMVYVYADGSTSNHFPRHLSTRLNTWRMPVKVRRVNLTQGT